MTLPTHRTVFPNGFTLLVREDRAAPVVAIVTRVKAGYFDEPDAEIGIAHVLEHMYFKGTPTRGPGEMQLEMGRLSLGEEHLQAALRLNQEIGNLHDLPDNLRNL